MHCHIVPCVDDGSNDIKLSLEMGKRAQKLGYTGIFATSHYIIHDNETDNKEYKNKIEELNETFKNENIDIKVYEGNEVFFTNDLLGCIENKKVSTLGGTKYVLVELPLYNEIIPMNVYEEFNKLQEAGYKPILAHPERYGFVSKNINHLVFLIDSGILMQANIASITGKYGRTAKKNIKKMIKNDMVHFLGTDSHSLSVYKVYKKAIKKIRKLFSDDEKMDLVLNENPKLVLEDKDVNFWYPKTI